MKRILPVFLLLCFPLLSFAQFQFKADTLKLDNPASFSFAFIPDIQSYVKYDYNQPLVDLMTAWIVENRGNLNVKAVLCPGDMVDQNQCMTPPHPRFGNQTSNQQWAYGSYAFSRFDNILPYVISTGNHDYGYLHAENSLSEFPKYYFPERNCKIRECLVATTTNRHGDQTLENAAYAFHDDAWGDILLVALEFGPRDEVLEWAKELCNSDKYKDFMSILLIHSYICTGNPAPFTEDPAYLLQPRNAGKAVWDKLVSQVPGMRLVLCGHSFRITSDMTGANGFRVDRNAAGKEVYQLMFDTQAIDACCSGNGGECWLRIYEFQPDGKTVKAHTYSPLFGVSVKTRHLATSHEPCNEFSIVIER